MQYAVGYQAKNGNIIAITESTSIRRDAEAEVGIYSRIDRENEYFLVERPSALWTRSKD